MSRRAKFGIVGGNGATGKAVVSGLLKSGDSEILLGGRDGIRLEAAAAEFGGRVSTACVDILDTESLDRFCSRCSLIINCGGPVKLLQDRVAHGALRARCHYVESGGAVICEGTNARLCSADRRPGIVVCGVGRLDARH